MVQNVWICNEFVFLKHAVAGNDFFFLSLNMGDGKEAYKVLQAGVLLEILSPLTRCHTGHPLPVIV